MATIAEKIIELKATIAEAEEELKVLTDGFKFDNPEDGIIPVGDNAIVLYSQSRFAPAKAIKAYPVEKFEYMYKLTPDAAEFKLELTEQELAAVSTPVRALKVQKLAEALADKEKFSK